MALLGFSEAAFVMLSFVYLILCRFWISAALELPIPMTEKGQKSTVRIVTANRGYIPCPKIRIKLRIGNTVSKKRKKILIWGSAGVRSDFDTDYVLIPETAGKYEIEMKKIRLYDLTGLFFVTFRKNCTVYLEVLPEISDMAVTLRDPVRNFFGEADVYDEFRPGHDAGEIFQIREFKQGDRIQNIHWKLSVKTDELMVRENSHPKACPVVVLLEQGYRKGKEDAFLQIAASISYSLMDAGCPHFMAWYSVSHRDVVRIRVDDEESFYQFLVYYISDLDGNAAENLWKQYRQKHRAENMLYELRLTGNLELFSGEEHWKSFHAGRLEEELSGTELIL